MKRAAKLACMLAGAVAAALAFAIPARAETEYITLTKEQTLALYGQSFEATYFTASGDTYPMTAEFYNFSRNISGDASDSIYLDNVAGGATGTNNAYATLWERDYVIYQLSFTGNWAPVWNYNAHIDFTLNPRLRGISSITQYVAFGIGNNWTPTRNNWQNVRTSSMLFNTSVGQSTVNTEMGSYGIMNARTSLSTPNFGVLDNEYIYYINGFYNPTYSTQTHFDLEGLVFQWYSPCFWGLSDSHNPNGTTYPPSYFLYIACPRLGDYTPPVETTTTAPATTRRQYTLQSPQSTAPAHTVDLSTLESGVAAIVQQGIDANNNLEWIGNNMYIGVNNLAYIANRLDDIYAAMQQAGQLPIDASLMSGVQSALTSYTTARIPDDATAGLTFWAWFMGKLTSVAFIGELAAFGAVLAVTYFILFRGRNS